MGRKTLSLLFLALFIYVAAPLMLPVAMGAVFAVLLFPWMERLERRKLSTSAAAGVVTLGVTATILIPAAILISLGIKAVSYQVRLWKDAPPDTAGGIVESVIGSPLVQGFIERLSRLFPISVGELVTAAEDLVRAMGARLGDALGGFFSQLPGMVMGLAVMVVSIYFLLVDGRAIMNFVRRNSVFGAEQTEQLISALGGMCRSVILATVASGLAQSLLFSLGCLVAGAKNVALIGFVVFLASFIPLVGSAPITFGVALHQLALGNRTGGIVLLIVAAVVGVVDNLIRPLVLKGSANLHPLLAFVGAFGGLQMLGFPGVFLGPILAGLSMVTLENLTRPQATD